MTQENNPYNTPDSDVEIQDSQINNLASRWSRLFAALIDGVLAIVITFPIMLYYGFWDKTMAGEEIGIEFNIFMALLSFVMFMILHGYLLKTKGQTIGKLALGIKIVTLDNKLPLFSDLILKRYVPVWIVQSIPFINILSLVDILFIFRADKRCIHDHIAGTKVVRIIN